MGQIAAHDVPTSRVPRRTKFFLLISNNFQYLFVVPTLALILFLDTKPIISLALGITAILAVSAFWTAASMDLGPRAKDHPHHRTWTRYRSILSYIAPMLRGRPAWQMSLIGWLLASILILFVISPFIVSRPLDLPLTPRLGFDLFWLAYIPVVIWISYSARDHATEWFTIVWTICAVSYAACFFVYYREEQLFDNLIHLVILLSWFLFLSMIVHYLIRRIANFRGQAALIQAITERLRDDRRYTEAFDARPVQNSPDDSLNNIAEHIGTMLEYDRVFILVRDPQKNELFMKGKYGINAPWPETGWSIDKQTSITGWVASSMEEHLCRDTENCSLFFNPDQGYPCKSEATVPIIVDETCVGIIDIESSYKNAFTHSDIRLLWQVANAIGAALSYERHVSKEVDKTHDLLMQASEILSQSTNLDDALKKVAQSLRGIFKADMVVLYKHAVTTCVPLPGLIVDGEVLHPEMLGHPIPRDSRVNELIRLPENYYISLQADTDAFLLGAENGGQVDAVNWNEGRPRFVEREKIKSMIFLKLGIGDDLVGSLFLNYRRSMKFPSRMIESLLSIANVLTMGLTLKRQVERLSGPLAGTTPLAHSTAEAAFESVIREFDDLDWKQIGKTAGQQRLLGQVQVYRGKLDELRREWTNLIIVEQMNLRLSSMVDSISHLELKLHSMFPSVTFKWESLEFLPIPANDFGEVVYKIVAEGVSNALVHAHAQRIETRCKWQDTFIEIEVCNDGIPIEEELANKINNLVEEPLLMDGSEKQTGIISILLDARRWFGAEWIVSATETSGTVLKVVLPLGMISEEEDAIDED
jgi:transcriptional regulator with GAF, ATPase, and Fis domain